MTQKASEISNIFNTVVLAVLGIGGVGGGVTFKDEIREFFAADVQSVVEYHDQDVETLKNELLESVKEIVEPVAKSAFASESNTLPPRIQNLLKIRCSLPEEFPPTLQTLLSDLRSRYQELNGREYGTGECREGIYYNSLGVRVD